MHNNATVQLEVTNLCKYYKAGKKKVLKAVDDISFVIYKGETLGIVGESGCGKTTSGKTCIGMLQPTSGQVKYQGKDVHHMTKKERFDFTGKVQMIFQDPYASLDPHQKVYDIVAEGIRIHKLASSREQEEKMVLELLDMVGLNAEHAMRNVHEFSGGQRQRIAIARSLASNPKLVVLDEPTSSIDVFSQAQILDLIKDLRRQFNLTNILISHDLGVVHELSNKIAVMYLGHIVEFGPAEEVFTNPRHPYTQALFDSIPSIDAEGIDSLKTLEGQIPSPINPPSGCPFHTRCAKACEVCSQKTPAQTVVGKDHMVSCLLYKEEHA